MNTELDEALSSMIDGEITDAPLLLRALAQPDAVTTLRGLVQLRATLGSDAMPSSAAVAATQGALARRATPVPHAWLRWAVAAAAVLLVGAALGFGLAPRRDPTLRTDPRPPAADLVADFDFDNARK